MLLVKFDGKDPFQSMKKVMIMKFVFFIKINNNKIDRNKNSLSTKNRLNQLKVLTSYNYLFDTSLQFYSDFQFLYILCYNYRHFQSIFFLSLQDRHLLCLNLSNEIYKVNFIMLMVKLLLLGRKIRKILLYSNSLIQDKMKSNRSFPSY